METLPFWKKIYQTVTGYSNNITNDTVEEILKLTQKGLTEGISVYKSFKEDSFTEWSKKMPKVDADVQSFVRRLSKDLNLDSAYAWLILCNYFMFEYYGKIKDIKHIARYESSTAVLVRNIWQFYSAERMFVIRTLRHIFEHVNDQDHPFYNEYNTFIKSVDMTQLKTNLIQQFEKLVGEITAELGSNSKYIEWWVSRNNREQTEILILIITISDYSQFNIKDFSNLITSFMEHCFTRHPPYFESTRIVPSSEFFNVKCAEIGCFISVLNQFNHSKNLMQFLVKNIEDELLEIQVQGNQTVVLFTWVVLKLKQLNTEDPSADQSYYLSLLLILFKKGVLTCLHEVMCNVIFKDNRAGNAVYRSIYDILRELLTWSPDHKLIYSYGGAVLITTELCRSKDLLHRCLSDTGGIKFLVDIAYSAFPYDFSSFTKLSSAILESETYFKMIICQLNNVNAFLSNLTATAPDGEYYNLNEEYVPFENIPGLTFPPATRVQSYKLFDKNLAKFIRKYSYFTLIRQMLLYLIDQTRRTRRLDLELTKKMVEGYSLVIQIVKHPLVPDEDVFKMQDCIKTLELVWPIFVKGEFRSFDLTKILFEMQVNLVMHRNQPLRRDWSNIFLPTLLSPNSGVEELSYKDIYEKCVTIVCLQEEERNDAHGFLLQYLELIHHAVETNTYHKEVQLAGVAYLLNHVFPFYDNWNYKNHEERKAIASKCLLIFHKILQQDTSCHEVQKRIIDFVSHSLFNNRVVVQSFFNLLSKGNQDIQNAITKQTFSQKDKESEMFKNVRLQLSILLFLTKYKDHVHHESFFYEKLKSFVKPLTSFISNAYSTRVAQLSCRLIEVMSRNSNIPMLALLEMDYHQVQSFFLEKLRDPLEDEGLKLVIIDLIETCIRNQHGMTAAFFNIPTKKQWDTNEEREKMGDTMTDFMLDYLHNIKKNPLSLENPLQLGILKILLNLWIYRKNNLIKDVVSLKQFWPLLANPLYCNFVQDPEIYTIIFRILSLQMCNTSTNIDTNLKQSVEKFFKDRKQMDLWMEFMDKAFQYIPESSSDVKANKNFILLKSWVELIAVTKKFVPEAFDEMVKSMLLEHCLDGALFHFNVPSYIKVPIVWMELYLMLITEWEIFANREKVIVEKFTNILYQFVDSFNITPFEIRKIYLSVIYKTLVGSKSFLEDNSKLLEQFLIPVGKILSYEYDELYYLLWNSGKETELESKILNWVLAVCIANAIMDLSTIKDYCVWFRLNNYIEKITGSFRPLFYNRQTTSVVKFMLESLIRYAQTPMVFDFMTSDLIKITENMRTPDNFYLWKESNDNNIPVYLREWCTSYMLLIKLLHLLVKKLGHKMVHNSCMFLMLHDKIINEILMLFEHSADKTVLVLIREILDFISTLMDWKYLWYCYFKDSFLSKLTGVKKCLNACISAVLRPKNLLCYTAGEGGKLEVVEQIPQTHLVTLANLFIEISSLASQCLLKASRTLIEYFDVYNSYDPIFEIIENDFRAPKFELPVTSHVTFGRLLCLVHFLCTTVNQLPSKTTSSQTKDLKSVPESLLSFSHKIKFVNLPDLLNHFNRESEDTVVFVQYDGNPELSSTQKLSSFFRYAMYEYTGLAAPWVSQLNRSKVEKALEVLMSLIASQIFLYTRIMDKNQLPHYKRELCAELLFITEFVKKRTSDQQGVLSNFRRNLHQERQVTSAKEQSTKDVSDINFLVVISHWFINICQLYGGSYYNY